MKLEQQVCSLELAKKLKELGVKQESLFYFVRISDTPDGRQDWLIRNSKWGKGAKEEYSAFTVAELGKMLPEEIHNDDQRLLLRYSKYSVHYILNNSRFEMVLSQTDTHNEADLRAKMLIYLIENKLQTIKKGK